MIHLPLVTCTNLGFAGAPYLGCFTRRELTPFEAEVYQVIRLGEPITIEAIIGPGFNTLMPFERERAVARVSNALVVLTAQQLITETLQGWKSTIGGSRAQR